MKKLKKIAKKWNALKSDKEKWEYVFSHKNELGLRLDNDSTYVTFRDEFIPKDIEDLDDLPELNDFEWWVGNSPGLDDLFLILDIKAEGV